MASLDTSDISGIKDGLALLKKRPKNFMDCIEFARMRFEKLFNHDVKQLLFTYPLDKTDKNGKPFWSLPKRPPVPLDFDKDNLLHCTFIASMACLRATIFYIEIPSDTPRSEEFRRDCGDMATNFEPEEFIPDESKAKEIADSVEKEETKDATEEKKDDEEEKKGEDDGPQGDDFEKLKEEFQAIYKELNSDPKKPIGDADWIEKNLLKSEEFEKDEDSNYHIDFMYSMGNCRATCYKLEPMEWITVKLKAGRIVPALATTTACVSGCQALELIKVVKGVKLETYRNIFLNLAVPSLQSPEPYECPKIKLAEGIEVTLWDRWEIKNAKDMKLQDMIKYVEKTYAGLEVRDVMKGNKGIYLHAYMNAAGKEQDKKEALESSLFELCDADEDDAYFDMSITCVLKGGESDEIIKGVPPVRVYA